MKKRKHPRDILTGVDDATKCPCIGSIMVAGVTAPRKVTWQWKRMGVKDSKLLSRANRDDLAARIKETAHAWSVRPIGPERIDDKSLNLNQWEMLTALDLLADMARGLGADGLGADGLGEVWVDNWEVSRALFFSRLAEACHPARAGELAAKGVCWERLPPLRDLVFQPEHRADENHVVVSAASILARHASDLEYDALRSVYGDFGSGSPGDPATRRYVWEHRRHPPPLIRTSWRTYKTLRELDSLADDPLCARAGAKWAA
ncbi:hypothetical protein [Desulfohalovibrio reitneri]|uniref:hypothetical protein n=1 Tax=Desulfohalovibrio reitneri TaxID=1307759 RepID=UPI00068A1021|nr:hypothetical protein [Desulfohalovibrio reitneri]